MNREAPHRRCLAVPAVECRLVVLRCFTLHIFAWLYNPLHRPVSSITGSLRRSGIVQALGAAISAPVSLFEVARAFGPGFEWVRSTSITFPPPLLYAKDRRASALHDRRVRLRTCTLTLSSIAKRTGPKVAMAPPELLRGETEVRPFSYTWNLRLPRDFIASSQRGDEIQGPSFEAAGHDWRLLFVPVAGARPPYVQRAPPPEFGVYLSLSTSDLAARHSDCPGKGRAVPPSHPCGNLRRGVQQEGEIPRVELQARGTPIVHRRRDWWHQPSRYGCLRTCGLDCAG